MIILSNEYEIGPKAELLGLVGLLQTSDQISTAERQEQNAVSIV
jgi:hypothetical protein